MENRTDQNFYTNLLEIASTEAEKLHQSMPEFLAGKPAHRPLAHRIKGLVAFAVAAGVDGEARTDYLQDLALLTERLTALQADSGLFDGDNLASPPDSSFTANDVLDALEICRRAQSSQLSTVESALEGIAQRLLPPLLTGGIHTPNHRWEICQALARLHRRWPQAEIRERIDQWLAEGIDIDADGQYSERSANYAAYVSNPSLITLGTLLDRPEYLDLVERNLDAVTAMAAPDGTVETVHSRRQDQKGSIHLRPFRMQLRRLALRSGRADLAWWYTQAAAQDPAATVDETTMLDDLAAVVLEPELAEELPAPQPPKAQTRHFASGLSVHRSEGVWVSVNAGSDYPQMRRVCSGLANNPTFLRLLAADGEAGITNVRLSREFFDLGPFRAQQHTVLPEGSHLLSEHLEAAYYQPLAAADRRQDADYQLEHEGRFAAAMSFSQRPRDLLHMDTSIRITPRDDGADLEVTVDGTPTQACLELGFRPGGSMDGAESIGENRWELNTGRATWTHGNTRIEIGPGTQAGPERRPGYFPGEEYAYLGATDAVAGPRLYLSLATPQTIKLSITFTRTH